MPRKRSDLLEQSEWKVMRIVWPLKSCAARDVYTRAREAYGWSPTTTKTILSRLVDKGYLKAEPIGNCYLYSPNRSALTSLRMAVDSLLENAIEGTTGPLLAHILKTSDLSETEIDALRDILDEHKTKKDDRS